MSKEFGQPSEEDSSETPKNELKESLELLVERNNPMADAAEKALDRL